MRNFSLLTDPNILLNLIKEENIVVIDSIPYKNVDIYGKTRINNKRMSNVKRKVLTIRKYKGNK